MVRLKLSKPEGTPPALRFAYAHSDLWAVQEQPLLTNAAWSEHEVRTIGPRRDADGRDHGDPALERLTQRPSLMAESDSVVHGVRRGARHDRAVIEPHRGRARPRLTPEPLSDKVDCSVDELFIDRHEPHLGAQLGGGHDLSREKRRAEPPLSATPPPRRARPVTT